MELLTNDQLEKMHTMILSGKEKSEVLNYLLEKSFGKEVSAEASKAFLIGYEACTEYSEYVIKTMKERDGK